MLQKLAEDFKTCSASITFAMGKLWENCCRSIWVYKKNDCSDLSERLERSFKMLFNVLT